MMLVWLRHTTAAALAHLVLSCHCAATTSAAASASAQFVPAGSSASAAPTWKAPLQLPDAASLSGSGSHGTRNGLTAAKHTEAAAAKHTEAATVTTARVRACVRYATCAFAYVTLRPLLHARACSTRLSGWCCRCCRCCCFCVLGSCCCSCCYLFGTWSAMRPRRQQRPAVQHQVRDRQSLLTKNNK